MKLICYREGRVGYHIGDIVYVPDNVSQIDRTYFKRDGAIDTEAQRKAQELSDAQEAQRNAQAGAEAAAAAQAKAESDQLAEITRLEEELAKKNQAPPETESAPSAAGDVATGS